MDKLEVGAIAFMALVTFGFIGATVWKANQPCAVYETRRVGDKWVGRNCNAFGCDDREFVPSHDERFCVSK